MAHFVAYSLQVLAALAAARGQPVRSARLLGAEDALRETIGVSHSPEEVRQYEPYIAAARAQMDEPAWEEAWAEGRAMTTEQAVRYALSEEETAQASVPAKEPPPATGRLTRREREVVSLIARGFTNRRIASELSISLRTVENHVRNVLKKLGLRSREEVADWANCDQG
jgi:DNA-binding NarL/FixJ family response regulator